ncbi:MAG: hypothetical protein ACK5Q5_01465 [Planctomycetaceae bacterium]
MKIPSRRFMRMLLKSTAGVVLGIPLLGAGGCDLLAEDPLPTRVVRGQSKEDGGAISRWWGRRNAEEANAAALNAPPSNQMSDAMAQQSPGMFGRLLGSSDPASAQSQRQLTRAQQKYFRRNPQMYQMYMLQQQMILLQQQQQIQQQYEEQAVPSRDSYDSLSIDPQEWADAPGRNISNDLSTRPSSKPWWETGETPTNARRRQASAEDFEDDVSQVPVTPTRPAPSDSASDIPDLFPAGDAGGTSGAPLLAPPSPQVVEAPQSTGTTTGPVMSSPPAAPAASDDNFGLSFPSETPASSKFPSGEPTAAPPVFAGEEPPPVLEPAPVGFIPPEPTGAAPPAATVTPDQGSPFFTPLPAAAPVAETAPSPQAKMPEPFPTAEPRLASPSEENLIPPEPIETDNEADASAPAMPSEASNAAESVTAESNTAKSVAAPTPVATSSPQISSSVPATSIALPSSSSSATLESPPSTPATLDEQSPYTGLKLDDAPLITTPAPAEPSDRSEPQSNPFRTATPGVSEPAPSQNPPAQEDPNPDYQFAPERTVAVPNPAPFIPPEPESYGQSFDHNPPLMAPNVTDDPELPAPTIAESTPSLLPPETNDAPSTSQGGWTPDPLQAPDPIVAPPTARRLVATPRPTQRETDSKIERISARRGLSGFKGFCPVALKDHRELTDARPEYSAVHNGRRYFFSSATAQELFEASPDDYVPMAMGNDVVHLMLTGESTPGSLEHAVWFRSRLYLFTSVETMETFVAAPSIHARDE